jgi:hypothetical protein
MKEVNLKLNIETTTSSKGIEKVNKEISDIPKGIKKAEKGAKDLNKGLKATDKTAGGIKGAINKIGLAFKAAGIGLIITAFARLTDLFMSNQKVMDAFNVLGETTKIVFNDLFNSIYNTADALAQVNGGFDALGKIVGSVITLALTPLKLTFQVLKADVIGLQLAYQELMGVFGASNEKEIKELRESLKETGEAVLQIGKDVGGAYYDIATNVVEATGEVVEFTTTAIDEISKIDVKSANARAKANIALAKAAEIARIQQQALVEEYDRQAEKLRQVRDEERNTITERIQANNDLKAVLDEQEDAMLKQVDLQIKQAQTQYNINDSQENLIALLEAKAEKTAVLAQIEGFRSEQLANDLALDKERLELEQSITDATAERTINELNAAAELIKSDEERILKQLENLEIEKQIEQQRLELKRDSYKEDTQAYVDSQIELENFISESNIRKAELDNELTQVRVENSKVEQATEEQKIAGVKNTLSTIANLANLFAGESEEQQKKAFKVQKAAGIAQALIDTYSSATAAYNSLVGVPFVGPALGIAAAAAAVTGGLLNVKQIQATQFQGGAGGGGDTSPNYSASTGSESQAPDFNIVGQSGFNQIATALGQNNSTPVKAYVVSGDVTTAQALDNNIIDTATF